MPRFWRKENPLDHSRLLELLKYDPETGHFYWRVARNGYGGGVKMTMQRANQHVRKDSVTGLKGVKPTRNGRYAARIRKHGICYNLGTYDTPEEASAAYSKAALQLFGEFARAA